jgi:L-aspartate oxidase
MSVTTYHYDYLIIGSGIAGLSAAKECAKHGKTAIITKAGIRESSTSYAQGGIAVAMTETDTPNYHWEDTLKAGAGLCDEDAVRVLVENGPQRVNDLIQMGANFDKNGSDFDFTKEAAHSHRRILHVGDATGKEIKKTLGNAVLAEPLATFFPNTFVKDLIIENGECIGCTAVKNNTPIQFSAKATLVATGGCGQVYSRTTNPPIATGDGIALGLRAGCEVQDMEFMQFHPTTLALGDKKPISIFLITEAVRGEGGVLRNIHGERFMPNYHPDAELAPRDIVARAIYSESQKTKNNVYLDLSPIRKEVQRRFPTIYERCLEFGIDINREFIPVSPAAHYFMGGLKTDTNAKTNIPRLYAAGETASLGLHGANRLASNSLLDGLVFGYIAAENMVKETGTPKLTSTNLSEETHYQTHKIIAARQALRTVMWRQVSIIREESELQDAENYLKSLSWILNLNSYDEAVCEAQNMLSTAQLITKASLLRKESRGAHFRKDYPEASSNNTRTILTLRDLQALR